MIVTIDDVRLAGYCSSGAKRWFDQHGLDFRDFLANGIPAEKFLATGCAIASHIVKAKLERSENELCIGTVRGRQQT